MGQLTQRAQRLVAAAATEVGKAVDSARTAFAAAASSGRPGAVNDQSAQSGPSAPLPRLEPLVAFGPGLPLVPAPLDPTGPSGRALPRRWEYPVSWNLPGQNQRLVPWDVLRKFADQCDIARDCINLRVSEIVSLDWDIQPTDEAVSAALAGGSETSRGKAVAAVREAFQPQIRRLREFWTTPDRQEGLSFSEWLTMLLEEHFVLDAIAVYPHRSLGGDLASFEVLDGSTIKPYLDHRGFRPLPPNPAFAQIIHGFPRGEFTASDDAADEFTADQLVYKRRYVRAWTPFGFSNTERALVRGELWMRRMGWLRAEYAEGATPVTFLKNAGIEIRTPEQMKVWEEIINQELAGQTAVRHRLRLLPDGLDPVEMRQLEERYRTDLDKWLATILCSAYEVMPTEIGITPNTGLGGKGHAEGEENVTYRRALRPTIAWLVDLLNQLSRTYLDMPADLTFRLLGDEAEDEQMLDSIEDAAVKGGRKTINEARADRNLPLYDIPEADMPFVETRQGLVFLEGASQIAADLSIDKPAPNEGGKTDDEGPAGPGGPRRAGDGGSAGPDAAKAAELRRFVAFAAKRAGGAWRDFDFDHVPDGEARRLNALGAGGELDALKHVAGDLQRSLLAGRGAARGAAAPAALEADLPKARARREPGADWPGWTYDLALTDHYAPRLSAAFNGAWGETLAEAARIFAPPAAKAASDDAEAEAARLWLTDHLHLSPTDVVAVLRLLYGDAYVAGDHAAVLMLGPGASPALGELTGSIDWSHWGPGWGEAADQLAGEGQGLGLAALLANDNVTITSIAETRIAQLGQVLADSVRRGDNLATRTKAVAAVLDDPRWARTVALTEVTRAMTAASLDTYRLNGIEGKAQLTAEDDRVCDECAENEEYGPVAVDDELPNGDPPTHPNCRCALVPVSPEELAAARAPGATQEES